MQIREYGTTQKAIYIEQRVFVQCRLPTIQYLTHGAVKNTEICQFLTLSLMYKVN